MTPAEHSLALVVQDRIEQLWNYRRWYRRLLLPSLEAEYRAELRSLLRLRSKARRIARQAEVMRTAAVDHGVQTWMAR